MEKLLVQLTPAEQTAEAIVAQMRDDPGNCILFDDLFHQIQKMRFTLTHNKGDLSPAAANGYSQMLFESHKPCPRRQHHS